MNIPIIYENIETPESNMNAQRNLSSSALAVISPNPTVHSEVNEK